MLAFIDWDIDPVFFQIGSFDIRYYSILFAIAFFLGIYLVRKMFTNEHKPEKMVDMIFIYTLIATIIGSRLGHVFFYNWDYYSQHLIEIFYIRQGGLASHGGAIAILIAMYIYHRKYKVSYLWTLDHIVVPTALAAFFIRMGNLMNSEIYGQPTDVPWAFRFLRLSPEEAMLPRHPTQIYEALFYLFVFVLLWKLYWKRNLYKREGALFGIFLIGIFGFRMIVECFKENQEAFEDNMLINMGQLLSIPFVILGICCLIYALRKPIKS